MGYGLQFNPDGTLAEYSDEQIDSFDVENSDVRQGGHPTHTRGMNSSTVRRTFTCLWEYLDDFINYQLGAVAVANDGSLSRLMPQTYPGLPYTAAIAVEEAMGYGAGQDDDDDVPAYTRARVVIRYEQVPFNMYPDDEITIESQRYLQKLPSTTDTSYLSLPGGGVNYINVIPGQTNPKPNGIPIPYNVGRPESQVTMKYRWLRLPYSAWGPGTILWNRVYGNPDTLDLPYVGTINYDVVQGVGINPGQGLFMGVEEELVTDPVGNTLAWNLGMVWLMKPQNHNWLYWVDVSTDSSNTAGYYLCGRGVTYYDTSTIPDGYSLFNARRHSDLFSIN